MERDLAVEERVLRTAEFNFDDGRYHEQTGGRSLDGDLYDAHPGKRFGDP